MTGTLEGKVALVTGASSGIGRATALAFARAGAAVALGNRSAEGGEETVRRIEAIGGRALFVSTDVTVAADCERLVARTVETFGRLDCACNNSGVVLGRGSRSHELAEDDWRRMLDVNLTGVFLCLKYEVAQMLRQGGGSIVNMSSLAGLVASPTAGAGYVASKHGLVGLSRSFAVEYAAEGIRVNALCPGFVRTELAANLFARYPEAESLVVSRHPIGRLGTPEEIGDAVVWLCSDASSFVTGHALSIDGGYVAQ